MRMNPLEDYLKDLREIHSTGAGVAETSFYPALANLLNEIGKSLKPKVRCVINLANRGAGLPDGGLFTPEQFQKGRGKGDWSNLCEAPLGPFRKIGPVPFSADAEPKPGQPPARGVLEAKPPSEDVGKIARTEQVERYCGEYGLVLVTNFRDFLLLGRDARGKPAALEAYSLAGDEKAFWRAADHPQKTAEEHGERFCEYLKRVMLSNAPLSAPQDLAWFLASYARDAKARVEAVADLPALAAVREALEEALGMKFSGERGEHFFRSTLVQTIFYGVFSAWVLWHRERPERTDAFNWHEAQWSLHVPFIRALYDEIATPSKLGSLGLVEVLDWTAGVLNRVDRGLFFENFQDEYAVQYFYEPFLEAFDPELRKELGVWYTPREIVEYQVARVDTVLREELDVADGLADPNVVVLDPCCGTGAYLVEVLRKIRANLRDKHDDGLVGYDVKTAAMTRVYGFEILPAAFVVAHLQIGLLLHQAGLPLSPKKSERVAVYLTNALTGWDPPKEPKTKFLFPELATERDAANHIKRGERILVILGNPPYNGFAGVAMAEERALTEAYRTTKKAPTPQGQGLNDLYVRFFRMAERRIVEMNRPGKGVVCFISNYSWLDGLSFTGMREHYLEAFDQLWVDCLNGDKYKTGKLTPEGEPDPSVFSTEHNREGIQVGTAITLLLRKDKHKPANRVLFRHFWGKGKRADLSAAARRAKQTRYARAKPSLEMGLSFQPATAEKAYFQWPLLTELLPVSFPGIQTGRDEFLVDIDRDLLLGRLRRYFDVEVSHEEMRRECPGVMKDTARFEAKKVRDILRNRGLLEQSIVLHCYRPFDFRWLYWEPLTKLLDEKRAEYFPHVIKGNCWIAAAQRNRKDFDPPLPVKFHAARHVIERGANLFPMYLVAACLPDAGGLFAPADGEGVVANLSDHAQEYVGELRAPEPEAVFFHVLSIQHAPRYRKENGGPLLQDWPRIPLPDNRKALERSAALGRQVAALLDTEAQVPGVTGGKVERALRTIGVPAKLGGGELDPNADDFAVTAGWGHAGKGGVTMPAKGRIARRAYDKAELEAIGEAAEARGLSVKQVLSLLGGDTCDVFLNDTAYWKNIPANVWVYFIGGYQVIKKWLSYREQELLGRALRADEAREVMNMARRIAAILLLQPALDENYREVKAHTYPWPGTSPAATVATT